MLKRWVAGGAPAFAPPGPADRTSTADLPSPLAVAVKRIFQDNCYECHRLGSAKNGIKVLNHDLLVAKRRVVVPGQPAQSTLYQALLTRDPKKLMPPTDSGLELTPEEIDTVRRWIESGAPPFPRTHRAKVSGD